MTTQAAKILPIDHWLDRPLLILRRAQRWVRCVCRPLLDVGFLLFCHPADFTPVCTSEFVALAKEQDKFAEMDVQLLGLSVDSVYSHMGWIEWIETKFNLSVNFPVIEDVSMDIARAYGMIDAYSDTTSTVRACLFVDPEQKVQALIHYPMHIGRSVDELLRVQRALIDTYQTAKVAPANWCPGDDFMQSAAYSVSGRHQGMASAGDAPQSINHNRRTACIYRK